MKATLQKINEYLATIAPHFELVKGNGYFYFAHRPDAPTYADVPESIYVCHLNHMTLEDWKKWVEFGIKEWEGEK